MAKVVEQMVVVRLSRLVKDADASAVLVDDSFGFNVEAMVSELVGEGTVVEVEVVEND